MSLVHLDEAGAPKPSGEENELSGQVAESCSNFQLSVFGEMAPGTGEVLTVEGACLIWRGEIKI